MDVILQITAFVITILVLVTVHEFGHFVVARGLGVKVLRFSVGFGPAMFSWHGKDAVEYRIAWVPLGGYVKLLDARETEVDEKDRAFEFTQQALWKRFSIVLAGPVSNLLFAIVALWLLFSVGLEQAIPVVGKVIPNTAAAQAGVKANQRITRINHSVIENWQDVFLAVANRLGDKGQMVVSTVPFAPERVSKTATTRHVLQLQNWQVDALKPSPLKSLGIVPYRPFVPTIIGEVVRKSPAARAGLRSGDKVLSIEGKTFPDWTEMVSFVKAHPNKTLRFRILRDKHPRVIKVTLTWRWQLGRGYVGYLGVKQTKVPFPKSHKRFVHYAPWMAVWPAAKQTWKLWAFHFVLFGKLLSGKVSLNSLGGPIMIYRVADQAFRQGFAYFLSFLSLISIMLAFVNVLPIPGLDGGHLLYLAIEGVRGKALSLKTQMLLLRLGIIFLIVIFVQATVNDILRLF